MRPKRLYLKEKLIVATLVIGLLIVGCKEKTTQSISEKAIPKKEINQANLQKTSFAIEGMTCAIGCAKTIQEELSALDGVQEATVDFDKKLATVSFDKTIQTPENLIQVVEKTGDGKTYTVPKLKS